jgi:probable rRNA maturation factor
LRVHLRGAEASGGLQLSGIRQFVRAVLHGEGVPARGGEAALTVVFTDDAGIRALNARFRDQDRATDVLAFPLHEEDEGGVYLGDVVISLERARTQAPRFGNDAEAELARLLSHGLLHLLGYDHHRPADGKRMKAAEGRALRAFLPGSLWDAGPERA